MINYGPWSPRNPHPDYYNGLNAMEDAICAKNQEALERAYDVYKSACVKSMIAHAPIPIIKVTVKRE